MGALETFLHPEHTPYLRLFTDSVSEEQPEVPVGG